MALKVAVFIGMLLAIAASFIAGRKLGDAEGHSAAVQQGLQQQINHKNTILADIRLATNEAKAASLVINNSIAKRLEADEQTTREIRHALKQTAALRINCVLPVDVMQQLNTARSRANDAAANGITSAVPTTIGTQ